MGFEEETHFDNLKKFLFILTTEENQTLLENYVKIFFSNEDWNIAKLNADMKKNIQNPDPTCNEENEKQIVQNLANLPSENIELLDQNIIIAYRNHFLNQIAPCETKLGQGADLLQTASILYLKDQDVFGKD